MTDFGQIDLPQLTIFGSPEDRLVDAMKIVSSHLHQKFQPIFGEISKNSCVLASLTVRDFMFRAGFRDVVVRPVRVLMRASRGGKEVNSVGVGYQHEGKGDPRRWAGHMAVYSPSLNYLIDTTLFQAQRKDWPFLPGMIAVPLRNTSSDQVIFGLKPITGMSIDIPDDDYSYEIVWLDDPKNNTWKTAPDTSKRRRKPVVNAMLDALTTAERTSLQKETSDV
jgi:hypothetical protein